MGEPGFSGFHYPSPHAWATETINKSEELHGYLYIHTVINSCGAAELIGTENPVLVLKCSRMAVFWMHHQRPCHPTLLSLQKYCPTFSDGLESYLECRWIWYAPESPRRSR